MAKSIKPSDKKLNRSWIIGSLVIGALAFLVYSNTLEHGYVLDDSSAITENSVVKKGTESIGNIWKTNYRYGYWSEPGSLYRPLTLSLFAWQYEVWPDNPGAAHVMNVLFYAVLCAVLFLFLLMIMGHERYWLALIAVLLFTLHPIHTEVVANIKSADELMSTLFSLAALMAFWKNQNRVFSIWLILSAVLFFFALTSKESSVTILPMAPLMMIFFTKTDWKKPVLNAATWLVPFGIFMYLRSIALQANPGTKNIPMIDNMLVNLEGAKALGTTFKLMGLYLWKFVFPHPLSHDYSFNEITAVGIGHWTSILSFLAVVGLLYLCYRAWKIDRVLCFGLLFGIVTFSLYTNLVFEIGTHFGERLLFMPTIGFCLAIAWLFWRWGLGNRVRFEWQKAILPLSVVALVGMMYSFKTVDRNKDWASDFDLYTADSENAPNSSRTHYRLGLAYMKERAIEAKTDEMRNQWLRKAVGELKKAVEIYPSYADAQGELGLAYQRLGYRDLAVERYEEALRLNPGHRTTLNNMGTVLFEQAKFDAAIEYFLKAIDRDERYTDAIGNLASCYGTIGQYQDAIKWFERAIEIEPRNASYYYYLGLTYQRMNNPREAEVWFSQAYVLDPSLRPKQ